MGKCALHLALRRGDDTTAALLCMYGDNGFTALKLRCAKGRTPCDDAAEAGHAKLAALFARRVGAALPQKPEPPSLFGADEGSLLVCWEPAEAPPATRAAPGDVAVCAYRLQAAELLAARGGGGGGGDREVQQAWVDVPLPSGAAFAGSGTPPSFTVKGLAPGRSYLLRLAAGNAFGWGHWSEESDVMTTRAGARGGGGGGAAASAAAAAAAAAAGGAAALPAAPSGGGGGGGHAETRAIPPLPTGGGMFWGASAGAAPRSSGLAAVDRSRSPPPAPPSVVAYGGGGARQPRAAAAAAPGAPSPPPPPGAARKPRADSTADAELAAELLRTVQMDLEAASARERSLEGALARLSGAPEALAELSPDGLAALEEELEVSLRLVRAAKERRMRAALGQEQNRALCAVCLDKPKETLFLPCKHLCACAECAATIMKASRLCPICRAAAADVLNVYA